MAENETKVFINTENADEINKRIAQIRQDIDNYRIAIENAEGALAEAERELDCELEKVFPNE